MAIIVKVIGALRHVSGASELSLNCKGNISIRELMRQVTEKMPKIITVTTDFGLKDPYAAEMKATILSISSDATIVDVTHGIAQFNIRMGAYVLASAAPYFPEGTIHVAVVDPGVGARRRPLLIQTRP